MVWGQITYMLGINIAERRVWGRHLASEPRRNLPVPRRHPYRTKSSTSGVLILRSTGSEHPWCPTQRAGDYHLSARFERGVNYVLSGIFGCSRTYCHLLMSADHSWWYQYSSQSNQQRTYHPFQLDPRTVLPRSTCRVNHPSQWTYSWCRRH